jgi:hypothetical protein
VSLKHDIEKKFGMSVKLKLGKPGALDVYVDGERIYSKAQAGRMPQTAEILSAIEERRS